MEAGNLALKLDKRYTYADYVLWDNDTRWELIDGIPYAMSAPSLSHQEVIGNIFAQFHSLLRGKSCRPFISPVDVRLNFDKGDDTVIQPDMLVVCDPKKLQDGKACLGAPDLVVEILSPSSGKMDRLHKFRKYLSAGVKEYWLVDPDEGFVEVHLLKDGAYTNNVYSEADTVSVSILPDCDINLAEVFGEAATEETSENSEN